MVEQKYKVARTEQEDFKSDGVSLTVSGAALWMVSELRLLLADVSVKASDEIILL